MDLSLYILFGAGAFIMMAAMLMKKRSGPSQPSQPATQKQWEQAEVEKSLQRFVQQVKQENEAVVAGMQRTKAEWQQEVVQLRDRLGQAEAELMRLTAQVQSLQSQVNRVSPQEKETEPEDVLALRERYRRAFEWKQQGVSLEEIAKRLGAGRGEIELIFSLAAPQESGEAHV